MTTRSVHTVVVAYHAADELERCLAALGQKGEVTVIDNSCSPEVHSVASRHGATYVDPGSNLGFGAGVNLALRQITVGPPRDVLLLNPDAVLAPGDVEVLADFLHRPGSERIAALSPRLVGSDGAYQRVEWPFPTPRGAWAEAVGLGRRLQGSRTFVIPVRKLARRPASAGRPGSRRRLQGSRTFVIPVRKLARRPASAGRPGSRRRLQGSRTFVIGAVMLLRWEALLEVGLFDERFFLYAEETDWQRRALALGWTSAVCEACRRHRGRDERGSSTPRGCSSTPPRRRTSASGTAAAGWSPTAPRPALERRPGRRLLSGDRRAEATRRAVLYLRGPRRCARLVRE